MSRTLRKVTKSGAVFSMSGAHGKVQQAGRAYRSKSSSVRVLKRRHPGLVLCGVLETGQCDQCGMCDKVDVS